MINKIEPFGLNSICCVCCRKKDEFNLMNTIPSVEHGGGNMMPVGQESKNLGTFEIQQCQVWCKKAQTRVDCILCCLQSMQTAVSLAGGKGLLSDVSAADAQMISGQKISECDHLTVDFYNKSCHELL